MNNDQKKTRTTPSEQLREQLDGGNQSREERVAENLEQRESRQQTSSGTLGDSKKNDRGNELNSKS